jgi:DNA-binding PadR family transcriptional regulator
MVFRQIDERFPLWGTSRSTIYDQLTRLELEGLIEEVMDVGKIPKRSRGRTRYQLTERGAEALDAFLAGLDLAEAPREYFVLALLCATWNGPDVTVRLLDDLERRVLARLNQIGPAPRPGRLSELGGWGLVKDEQLALNARLAWIEKMRQATEELTGGSGAQG